MNPLFVHDARRALPPAMFAALFLLVGCNRADTASKSAPPTPAPQASVPSVAGNWSGTQTGISDVNNTPFRFTAQFLPSGTYTLSGSWQGRNGPAGQTMSGSYTQSGTNITLSVTHNEALAAGEKLEMPNTGLTLTGSISADGRSIHVGHGALADYQLTRN